MATQDFWGNIGSGLLGTGAGYMTTKAGEKDDERRKAASQDPLFMQMQNAAGQSMSLAGNTDPKAHAAERFGAQQALVEPGNKAKELEVLRRLHASGTSGLGSNAPVAGTVSTPGQPVNPQLAALYAAQQGAKETASYNSLREGEGYLNNMLSRAGMLSNAGNNRRTQNLAATPSKSPGMGTQLLSGLAGSLMKNPGMLGQGFDAIKSLFGGDSSSLQLPATDPGGYDFGSWSMPSQKFETFDYGYGGSDGGYDWF